MQNYLSQTGIDILINDAFKQVAICKPSDPIVYIAEYLQQRGHTFDDISTLKIISSSTVQKQQVKSDSYDELDQRKQLPHKTMKVSSAKLIKIEDLDRPFIKEEGITITLRKVAGVNYQQVQAPQLQDIPEGQEPNEDDDDFEQIKETQKPGGGVQMDNPIYKNTISKNSQNSSLQQNQNMNSQEPEDHLNLYMMIQNNTAITLSDIIEQFKDDFDLDELYKIAAQNQTLAQVDYENNQNDKRTPSAKMLEKYLMIRSKKYQNLIEINELAQGAEAIVFRLEHREIDEVVVKTNKILELSENQDYFQQPFIDFMRETLQLKLLQNKNYIAEVREEIIEYDLKNQHILRYCVVVERAQRTLEDLLKIWNNPDQSEKYVEAYSPEKLAYIFYQTLSIIKYLHKSQSWGSWYLIQT
ncbi:UNKNOWN [Stylonychia lemnae]|uniref:Uncharacterized protein n=1 Tax=Stylonychia lemnae TaxID=5949 RepID=A0A078ABZ1_STYLE|nr:UNKNOWN [Stylonychia lemnae]|eukprot:CDW79112.1 UNKNOWN [Stylonychia lemnae]